MEGRSKEEQERIDCIIAEIQAHEKSIKHFMRLGRLHNIIAMKEDEELTSKGLDELKELLKTL